MGTVRHAQVGLGGPGGVARTNVVVSMTNQVHVQLGVVAVHITKTTGQDIIGNKEGEMPRRADDLEHDTKRVDVLLPATRGHVVNRGPRLMSSDRKWLWWRRFRPGGLAGKNFGAKRTKKEGDAQQYGRLAHCYLSKQCGRKMQTCDSGYPVYAKRMISES